MKQNDEIITTPPVDAASVLLLRDSAQGLQVLLMRRAQASQVLGGAYVFPGGKLDTQDHAPEALQCLSESPEQLHQRLAEPTLAPQRAAGLFMAVLREAFEECGVLAGQDGAGAAWAAQLREHLPHRSWHESLNAAGLRLRTQALLPWSRWITPRLPSVSSKRFDTRFFVAAAPAGQDGSHDANETVDLIWTTPAARALSMTAARSVSKLSWARLMPMSISATSTPPCDSDASR